MRLSANIRVLSALGHEDLLKSVLERRAVIRDHRDQKGDDRCWLDDQLVWLMLSDTPDMPSSLPPFEYAMDICINFYLHRNSETEDPTPPEAILDKARWDDDIRDMTPFELLYKLCVIQVAIMRHRNIFDRPRTADDDRRLYSILPEKIPADFRLPPKREFLGELKSPNAGCPAFWRSHANCPNTRHNLHQWGTCA